MAVPQENSVLEKINKVIANLARALGLQNNYLEKDDCWECILAAIDFSFQIMHHTML